ncbi:permease for cytosine/purines, uracil, thiamine, allantoin-domain-containing protein [Hyaloscypha finlandica]|nr:permease for cytosine/purines, uracil, thiamine, allantoin-domain-containing protein [Hyaloscypha finlandica]KAH8787400.1 permease for cytosine/purines, uracil, thiamine, allantoin-domain-containing protein [Hyaloscypha sp. PMI_1271]
MGAFSKKQADVEAVPSEKPVYGTENDSGEYIPDEGAVAAETFVLGDSWYAKTQRFAGKFGVEQRGIERVPSDERDTAHISQVGTMWLSANMVVSSFAIGALAYPIFYLGFVDTILIILFVNLLGIIPVAFFSTFGPRFGLRQMVLSRFFFGYYGVKVVAVFNILACVGWSAVNVIVGAQLFNAVNSNMPGWAGIILIAAATFLITLFGYKVVHTYERYSWIPCFIIFLIVIGEFAHSGHFSNIPMGVGLSEAGSALSFAASVFGFATGWTSYAADYTVYQPVGRSRKSVFIWTYAGLAFPLLFTEMLGAAVATAMAANEGNNVYIDGYHSSGIGGLLAAVIVPPLGRFGQFCLVVLALSIIANNCPNIYSVSLSLQLLARVSQRVPRFVWTFIGTLIYCAIAIPGYGHFESVLENFMLLIAYWLAIYEGIAVSEHVFYKRGMTGYDPSIYMDKDKLPPGIAAIIAFCFGIMGAVLGMAQVWFTGPIGKLCGTTYGGDVGFELAFGFAATSYTVLRYFEKKHFGR